ncbi:hypothetical protein K0M31_014693 [Melipona bicolor]|uniref:Uncharacterized protein n=1 Tax=Melipona bicolor TaxID=60889 RepID=A0AA40FHE4_9HYME|nr:hypothetical protein K0M31_014693 [Melipona bicolor]
MKRDGRELIQHQYRLVICRRSYRASQSRQVRHNPEDPIRVPRTVDGMRSIAAETAASPAISRQKLDNAWNTAPPRRPTTGSFNGPEPDFSNSCTASGIGGYAPSQTSTGSTHTEHSVPRCTRHVRTVHYYLGMASNEIRVPTNPNESNSM